MDDRELLSYYLERGGEGRWNLSVEAAYLDYRLRSWAAELDLSGTARACNVGIGEGSWDDYLGYLLEGRASVTSVDVDARICALLEYRQRREGHPNPSRVVCADLLAGPIAGAPFDLVTVVGSTMREIGDHHAAVAASIELLAPRGVLFYADFLADSRPERFLDAAATHGAQVIAFRDDRTLPDLGLFLYVATPGGRAPRGSGTHREAR
jgi:SAM-dependent methyltransferase